MRRDKKAAKKKKNRELARRDSKRSASSTSFTAATKLAHASEKIGPTFMSGEWRSDELPPLLVNVVVTRVLPDKSLFAHCMMIDRTCLGVKNAFSVGPMGEAELANLRNRLEEVHEAGVEPVEFATAQSVVFHAIAYAKTLGFDPHEDYDEAMLKPFPATLVDVPLARPDRPFYVPGPDDDVDEILATLDEAVGEEGYDYGDPDALGEGRPDEVEIGRAVQQWGTIFGDKVDHATNIAAYIHALTGAPVDKGNPVDESLLATSLPFYWGMLFRPLEDGKTGLDHARASKPMAAHANALERLASTRASFFEIHATDPARGVVICRDVYDGTRFDLRVEESFASKLPAGSRGFGYVTPLADRTWFPPSSLVAHPMLGNVVPGLLLERLNELLAKLGIAERVDPQNAVPGLTRWGALMHGVVTRAIAPPK